jgi:exopolyphosphatase/guanosine-5'-triphosphate,3'-diphosphate pyrophosphatase
MNPQIKAVVDVGTNSVKLLVAEVTGGNVVPLLETSRQTRLGRGLYQTHQLQPSAITDTAGTVRRFMNNARELNAGDFRVIATSAARDAVNVADLTGAIRRLCDVEMEIISGDQEAELVYRGVRSAVATGHGTLMIVDVGGGSTEIIVGSGEHPDFHRSYQVGTVRLLEKFPHSDPPAPAELHDVRNHLMRMMSEDIVPGLEQAGVRHRGLKLVGTGGTTTLLARMHGQMKGYDRELIEKTVLTRTDLDDWVSRLWNMNARTRKNIVGLPAEKADVILMGALIYECLLKSFCCERIHISMRGLRFGVLLCDAAGGPSFSVR